MLVFLLVCFLRKLAFGVYLFFFVLIFNIIRILCVVSGSKDMVLKLDPQTDKEPSLMVHSM